MSTATTKGLNYTENISIDADGRSISLQFRYRYHPFLGQWRLSVYDAQSGDCYIESIPLLYIGDADLIAPFSHLGIGAAYVNPLLEERRTDNPSLDSLGVEYGLLWGGFSSE